MSLALIHTGVDHPSAPRCLVITQSDVSFVNINQKNAKQGNVFNVFNTFTSCTCGINGNNVSSLLQKNQICHHWLHYHHHMTYQLINKNTSWCLIRLQLLDFWGFVPSQTGLLITSSRDICPCSSGSSSEEKEQDKITETCSCCCVKYFRFLYTV